jgi:PPOX class probable F420-dependent enzyme
MDDKVREFLEQNHTAAMITLRPDGTPHAVRVAVGLMDGKLLSSGTRSRARTKYLRRDPRCTLFVFEGSGPRALTLETTVHLIEGPSVPELSLRYFRMLQPAAKPGTIVWFGQERTEGEFSRLMVDEGRLLYEFEVQRTYGLF